MSKHTLYLVAHESVVSGPLEHPIVAATITTDPDIVGTTDVHKMLTGIAGRLGLCGFEITAGDPTWVPGHQFNLPLGKRKRRCASSNRSSST